MISSDAHGLILLKKNLICLVCLKNYLVCLKNYVLENHNIGKIRSHHQNEFENANFAKYFDKHGIIHEFSAPTTLEQNGIF